jgi:hypothetical protein
LGGFLRGLIVRQYLSGAIKQFTFAFLSQEYYGEDAAQNAVKKFCVNQANFIWETAPSPPNSGG